ncbi:MAG: hypothetical protein KH353_10645 [Clostridium sp.]|nr:hypothetical protein [Clostridium sp.]
MNISEKQLRDAIIRAIAKIEAEEGLFSKNRKKQKIYMVCAGGWDERYLEFLKTVQPEEETAVPVLTEVMRGQEHRFYGEHGCRDCMYLDGTIPSDLVDAVTVFPVVPRDLISKTALGISDTPQTQWIVSCMEAGSRIVFLTSGLVPFTGREPKAYVNRILSYYRTVLEYGIELSSSCQTKITVSAEKQGQAFHSAAVSDEKIIYGTESIKKSGKKRVISAKDVEQLQRGGVLLVEEDDIITDLARDRARFLQVTFKTAGH